MNSYLQPPPQPSAAAPTWWNTLTLIGGGIASAAMTVGGAVLTVASTVVHSVASKTTEATATSSAAPSNPSPPPVSAAASTRSESSSPLLIAEKLRSEAHALKSIRDQHYNDSQACFGRGDRPGAKTASERRNQTQQQIVQLRAQAAELLYAHHNAGRDLREIDLHGLYVEEALAQLQRRINAIEKRLRSRPTESQPALKLPFRLTVIVGRGNHSRDKISKLRPAVDQLIQQHRLRVYADMPNPGCVTVEFGSNQPAGWVGRITDSCAIM